MFKFYTFIVISCISSYMVYIAGSPMINKNVNNEVIEKKEIMTLEIPKINFKGNIYNKNSELNDIDKNIIIMNESDMPDKENGILIIGGHSGYGQYAYFKDLNKLSIDDQIKINYLGKTYTYKVVDYHLDSKDGSIRISNVNKKNKLFLYTCNPNDKNNYLVYVCERI